jgi:cytoskeletal protein CcmA (bactofilin family)
MAKTDNRPAQDKQTTVEEGTEFKGTLQSTCHVVVRGVVDGDLTAPTITVSETGTVIGNVKADSIRSEGVLAGRVDADDVYLSGSVRSDTVIRAKHLEVKLQRRTEKLEVTFGECILEVGDDPALEKPDAVPQQAQAPMAATLAAPIEDAAGESDQKSSENGKRRSVPPPPS